MDQIEDWLKLDLQERRYITVVGKADVEKAETSDSDSSSLTTAKIATGVALATPLLIPLVPALAVAAGVWLAGKASDSPPVLRVPSAFVKDIDFGPQGWEPNVVYAVNPKQPMMYRSLARFHEELLLHKISELDRLLNALGAREYSIRHIRSRSRHAAAEVRVGPFAEASGQTADLALCERIWSGTSDGHEPALPDGLVWYPSEPDWRNLADSRFRGTRRSFAFSVRQDETFGVDAVLASKIEALNLKIGGRYASVDHVEFAVSGTF